MVINMLLRVLHMQYNRHDINVIIFQSKARRLFLKVEI